MAALRALLFAVPAALALSNRYKVPGQAETVYGDSGEAAVFVTPYLPDRYTEAQALSESKVLFRVLRIEQMNER